MASAQPNGDDDSDGSGANPQRRSMKQMLEPNRSSMSSYLALPAGSDSFVLKPGVINLLPSFHGIEQENPYNQH